MSTEGRTDSLLKVQVDPARHLYLFLKLQKPLGLEAGGCRHPRRAQMLRLLVRTCFTLTAEAQVWIRSEGEPG